MLSESTTPIARLPSQASVHSRPCEPPGENGSNRTPLRQSRGNEPSRLTHEVVSHLRDFALSDAADIEVTVEDLVLGMDEDEVSPGSDLKRQEDLQADDLGSSRVTFRPRVRITSGLSRLRQSALYNSTDAHQILSASSSRSCSPSSSISAPLRFHSEEPVPKPGWGSLGQRVSLLARRGEHKRRYRERIKQHERMIKTFQGDPFLGHLSAGRDERSPLLGRRRDSTSSGPHMCPCGIVGCEYDVERRISKEIDVIFGSWPRRLWNPKWWWWHIQPVICCRCLDDPDEEYY